MMWEISAREYLLMGGPIMGPLVLVSLLLAYLIAERLLLPLGMDGDDLSADEVIKKLEQGAAPKAKWACTGRCLRDFWQQNLREA